MYLAGACPVLSDGTWVRGSFEEQARQAFTNLRKVAEAAAASLSDAVRAGVYLRDYADFDAMNKIYVEFFGTDNLPARTTLPVALNGFDIELDAIGRTLSKMCRVRGWGVLLVHSTASRAARATNVPAKIRRIQARTRGRDSTWSRIPAAAAP